MLSLHCCRCGDATICVLTRAAVFESIDRMSRLHLTFPIDISRPMTSVISRRWKEYGVLGIDRLSIYRTKYISMVLRWFTSGNRYSVFGEVLPVSFEPLQLVILQFFKSSALCVRTMAGRPRADRIVIVQANEILDVGQIRAETWRNSTLSVALNDNDECLMWLARRRLLRNSYPCRVCGLPCKLINRATSVDGKQWACGACRHYKSIRDGSFFARSHLPTKQIMQLVYSWSRDWPQNMTSYEVGIGRKHTVIDWFNFCREECGNYVDRNFSGLGGFDVNGEPTVVEVDESKYFHRKYHRGLWTEGHWVFGAVERVSGKCFLTVVPDRSAATLEPLILQHILPGTHIISDGWAAYRNLNDIGHGIYQHSFVVHERNFVDPHYPEIHMQNIENLWMRAKRKLRRQFGTSKELFPSYLKEFQYREMVGDANLFSHFLTVDHRQLPSIESYGWHHLVHKCRS